MKVVFFKNEDLTQTNQVTKIQRYSTPEQVDGKAFKNWWKVAEDMVLSQKDGKARWQ